MERGITPLTAVLIAALVIVSVLLLVQYLELQRMRNVLIDVTLTRMEEEYRAARESEVRYLNALRNETGEIMSGLEMIQGLNDEEEALLLRGKQLVDRIDWLTSTVGSGSMASENGE